MITKVETLRFIESVKKKVEKGNNLSKTQAPEIVKSMLKSSKTVEEFYFNFGKSSADMDSQFKDIVFREDCYDYLIKSGMPKDKALKLTDIIRKGRFNFLKDSTEYDNFLENSFINWAKGVKYLSYRERCMEVFEVLYKDNDFINQRSKQEEQFKILADMIRNGDYEENLLPKPRRPYDHNFDHNSCDFSLKNPKPVNEKRICRCWNYYNKQNRDEKCKSCPFKFKKENIGDIKIVDFEVPTKFNIAKLGEIDWLLKDGDEIFATEVKPPESTETLVRMIAEILTYTVDSEYKPAICFFNGSKQHHDYDQYKDNADFQYIIKQTGIRVFCITFDEDKFEIHDIEKNSKIKQNCIDKSKLRLNQVLDYAIMQDETAKNPELKSGYKIGNRIYDNYLENNCFKTFVKNMEKEHETAYKKYDEGSGGELKETKSPPKMASFGSSSRMIFNLMKDVQGFLFEEKLPTIIGGTAHLDGFMETDSKYIFVEAKCREPYSTKNNVYDRKYKELYEYISNSDKLNVSCDIEYIKDNEKEMKVTFKVNDKPIRNFDMKQMISHLLGVATAFLNGRFEIKDIEFIYLLFDPATIEIEDEKAKTQIHEIYNNTYNECNTTDFKALFEVIVDYLKSYKNWPKNIKTSDLTNGFTFKLCSQNNMDL
ncbi:MAG: hypothetical protein IKW45_01865 [Clostridia bacterium]|nr:hypothetical protein [Clostridia bacterium]